MKTTGLILIIVGGLASLIGLGVIVNGLTSNYASSTCAKWEASENKYNEAKRKCNSLASDLTPGSKESFIKNCNESETIGLTGKYECESAKNYLTKQFIKGIVAAVIGFLLAIIGFFFRRRKAIV